MTIEQQTRQTIEGGRIGFEHPNACPIHSFAIGAQEFLLDGEPFVIRCGEIHFPRVPREYWRHRLQMCRALGLNAVCVYLFWNFHEWEEGRYDWEGQADAAEFCRLAQEEGLWVVLRPGPYSCAEWEMGGLPWWLTKREGIQLRSTDSRFLEPANAFLREVGKQLASQQVTHGGPILMVQVENEYGSFGHDAEYMGALREALIDGGFDVPLFACNPTGDLANGYREDLFQVVNFGAGAAKAAFERLRQFQPTGPLMNGEYYPAWFDMWGRKHRTGAAGPIVEDLEYMLANRHSFSIYMAHGGTSFGLWAGADRPFSPDTTSYDYDAPVSEAGWLTPKFTAIRDAMAPYLNPGEHLTEPPPANPVVTFPTLELAPVGSMFGSLPSPIRVSAPETMESYDQSRGAILYRTMAPAGPATALSAKAIHDFAWVYLDGKLVGAMDRRSKRYRIELPERTEPGRLDVLVYAMGRVNFGQEIFDRKGLHSPVTLGNEHLSGWEVFPLPLDETTPMSLPTEVAAYGPLYWRATFELLDAGDTFLDMRGWGKGVVWVNGHMLGRFWNIGPTQTLYVPGPWLRNGRNEVVVLDFLGPRNPTVAGLAAPILDERRPDLDFVRPARATGEFVAPPPTAEGAFTNEVAWQSIAFAPPVHGRYLCVEALSAIDGGAGCAIAELDALDRSGLSLPRSGWKVLWVSSEETNYFPGDAENAIDGQTSTFWHTESGASALDYPHRLVVDLGERQTISAVRYLPRSGEAHATGRIRDFRLYLSDEPFGLQSAQ